MRVPANPPTQPRSGQQIMTLQNTRAHRSTRTQRSRCAIASSKKFARLLQELGSGGAVPMLSGSSHLDADLGFGSLERVELMSRLENAFGVRISDQAATQSTLRTNLPLRC